MTKVGYGNLTVNEGRQWEESGVRFREKCVTSLLYVWPTYQWWQVRQSLSLYQVIKLIKRISGQTGVSLYGYTAGCRRRHTRTLSRGATRLVIQQLRLSAA